ncbi:hypothetical protein Q5762_01445 [Streptomyces sp. P9(2023)]|uniref:hypothetical protein n=1 Tax=Streptomyces sp. P9(2023) TaxID=3064394 RepID=UPI0028F45EDB|nr:hypothetical protein [Streptomyces sp. P9(2023)]MDT9687030.1 hypothetical protein [Streptomyces sp. P9(2023)]
MPDDAAVQTSRTNRPTAQDHDRPDVIAVDRAGREEGATEFDDGEQGCEARESADDLKDHHGRETPEVGTEEPPHARFLRGFGFG